MESINREQLAAMVRAATEDVFGTMLGVPVECLPCYDSNSECQSFDGVIALVGLAGTWTGAGQISCSSVLACRLSGALLASEYAAVNEDVLDAMSEITNMIIGNVKSSLEDRLGPMGLSIPTVIFGRNYQARSSGVSQWTVAPFRCDTESFEVRIALVPNTKAECVRGASHAPELHEVC